MSLMTSANFASLILNVGDGGHRYAVLPPQMAEELYQVSIWLHQNQDLRQLQVGVPAAWNARPL